MRIIIATLLFAVVVQGCNNRNIPDVSNIKINIETERFEKKLFDTSATNLMNYINEIQNSSTPSFHQMYFTEILGVDPKAPKDSISVYVNQFIKAFRPVYDTAEKVFSNFAPYEQEIKEGLQFVKYYFPNYPAPQKVITYIGPADGYGDVILPGEALLVGLHHHLGAGYSLYQTDMVRQYYPDYISRRFEPSYIAVNAMKNIVLDIFPEKGDDQPLIKQMIEKGKRLYVLQQLLPHHEAAELIGYTPAQYKDCVAHETAIWDLFIKNNYLQVNTKNIIKDYIEEGPKTQELGEGAPGNIGSFAGWQIVKKYMQKNDKLTLSALMNTDAEIIFQEAKYKP
ncbi:MAG: hypothetical protein ACOYKE_10080 [Ferruginibacter sp.]